jgi:hypothetical protein
MTGSAGGCSPHLDCVGGAVAHRARKRDLICCDVLARSSAVAVRQRISTFSIFRALRCNGIGIIV